MDNACRITITDFQEMAGGTRASRFSQVSRSLLGNGDRRLQIERDSAMSELIALPGHTKARLSFGATECVAAQPRARQNRLLDLLPAKDFDRLLPALEFVLLPAGSIVHGAGCRERYLYFLTSGIVSHFHLTRSGASAGLALTGNEGVIGVTAFLGGESTLNEAMVLCTGYAYRLPSDGLNEMVAHVGSLSAMLLRYTQALMSQIGQMALCYRFHSVEQQLCRWLLSCLDRLPSNELTMTQAQIAGMLGVRREGVTEAAGRLQREGLIHCSRGHLTVLDRPRLEEQVCECYAVINREYERLIPSGNCHGPRPGFTAGAVESMRGGWVT